MKLPSTVRIALLTFAGTFTGALLADGSIPVTWVQWKAKIAPAFAVSVFAEVALLRKQLVNLTAKMSQSGFINGDAAFAMVIMGVLAWWGLHALGCSPSEMTTLKNDAVKIEAPLEQACLLAQDIPASAPYVDLICSSLEAADHVIANLPAGAASKVGVVGIDGGVLSTSLPIRVRCQLAVKGASR